MIDFNTIKAGFLGAAAGDALGVPVEFLSREALKKNPVTDMRAFGTHHQPAGTWSDDSSLIFCTAESLCGGYNPADMARCFTDWLYDKYWSPRDEVFDIGNATRKALGRLRNGVPHTSSGLKGEEDNGNGSLMRILPLAFHLYGEEDLGERMRKVHEVSSITHAHPVSCMACSLYVEVLRQIIRGAGVEAAIEGAARAWKQHYTGRGEAEYLPLFARLPDPLFRETPEGGISSGGFVVHTLEAALWCVLNSGSYEQAVLLAVNLGGDTDTTACVAGGLAGIAYGPGCVPSSWLDTLARRSDIEDLASRLAGSL